MNSLTSLISIGLILASPAFSSAAMAADIHTKANTRHVQVSQHRPAPRAAARSGATGTRYGGPSVDPTRIIESLRANPWVAPYMAQYGGRPALHANPPHGVTRGRGTHAPAASSYDNSPWLYDPSPSVDVDNSQSQAAIDASDQAIQQVDQDTFQMDENLNQ
jgi:hypothetical protein